MVDPTTDTFLATQRVVASGCGRDRLIRTAHSLMIILVMAFALESVISDVGSLDRDATV